jgi:hypothetical protein
MTRLALDRLVRAERASHPLDYRRTDDISQSFKCALPKGQLVPWSSSFSLFSGVKLKCVGWSSIFIIAVLFWLFDNRCCQSTHFYESWEHSSYSEGRLWHHRPLTGYPKTVNLKYPPHSMEFVWASDDVTEHPCPVVTIR